MLRHAAGHARSTLLFDFLAPTLLTHSRRYTTPTPTSSPLTNTPITWVPPSPESIQDILHFIKDTSAQRQISSVLPAEKLAHINNIIQSIENSIAARANDELLYHWKLLDEQRLLNHFSDSQLQKLSKCMIRAYYEPRRKGRMPPQELDRSVIKFFENVAFLSAKGGSLDALNALMKHYVKEKDTDTILRLYNKFMKLIGDVEPVKQTTEEEEDIEDMLATELELEGSWGGSDSGRVHLLLAAITAHALKDSFEGAVDTYLKTSVRFVPEINAAFFKSALEFDTLLWNKIKRYIFRLDIAKLVAKPTALTKQITNFSSTRTTEKLEKLYKTLKMGITSNDAYIAADPSLVTKTKKVAMDQIGWSAFLVAFLKCNRKDMARSLWDDLGTWGVKPDVGMWTALIDSYEEMHNTDDALAAWNMMLRQGIQPDDLTFRAILAVLLKARRTEQGMELFRKYRSKPIDISSTKALSVFNTVINGLLRVDAVAEATELRAYMVANGPKPDLVTYNSSINYFGRRGKFSEIVKILKEMQSVGLEGDVFTYTTVLSALLKAGKKDASELVLSLMDKQGLERNVTIYSAIIDAQLREGSQESFYAAIRMLNRMEQDPRNQPNEITYTGVLTRLYHIRWMDPDEVRKWHEDIVGRIQKRGLVLGLPTYHVLIKACLAYEHENGVQQALDYLQEMKQRELPIVNTTWYILLAGMAGRQEWALVDKLVKEMYSSGFQPSGTLLRLVQKIDQRVRVGHT